GGLTQPEISQTEGIHQRRLAAGGDAEAVAVRDVQCLTFGVLPWILREHALHLRHQTRHLARVERCAVHARERFAQNLGVDLPTRHHAAQHLLEIGRILFVVCHANRPLSMPVACALYASHTILCPCPADPGYLYAARERSGGPVSSRRMNGTVAGVIALSVSLVALV